MKNGVLWSLLLFLFDYDYTLDESGVNTDETSNQQKSANNLARLSILAIVAVCGYELKLVLDPNDPLNIAIRYQTAASTPTTGTASGGSSLKASAQSSPTTSSSYTSNATNLIQNNAIHAIQMSNNNGNGVNKTSNFTSYVVGVEKIGDAEEAVEAERNAIVEKENFANNRKYTISGNATNLVVKKIVDCLLTKYITDKFATHNDSDVLKILTSNTRNPYIIWDNATRAQLADFLEYQRIKSTKEQYADITDIYDIVSDFTFDAHK